MAQPRGTVRSWGRRFWHNWGKPLLVVAIVLGSFRSAVADWNDVPTGSMKPTILEGDRILVNKLAYDLKVPFTTWHLARWGDPQRGDVVVLFEPDSGRRLVKRVIGLPGDSIALENNRLVLNGEAAPYGRLAQDVLEDLDPAERAKHVCAEETLGGRGHPVMATPGVLAPRSFGPLTVPAGHYFVMGDNRDESRDSRYFGFVPRNRIVGRARAIALSFDPQHYYLPRWERFCTPLP
ncbi:MAG TPA: signal peptidase I [Phycisphaerae bacterium]|nr:signal peptidase I [Phycisphaerae bacterium]HNU44194.1 signal peptidase I [Phycisphaerae bacterium]